MIKVQVNTPASKDNPAEMTVEEIPLPPPELWPSLDNTSATPVAKPVAPAEPAKAVKRDIEALAFVRNDWSKVVPLEFAFDHPTLGHVSEIRVRRLTVGEVGDTLDQRADDVPDNFDIYERMTGIPASVLRGLMDVDGQAVTAVCFDFLPPLFRPLRESAAASLST